MEEEGAGGKPIRRRLEVGQGPGSILLGIPVSGPPLKDRMSLKGLLVGTAILLLEKMFLVGFLGVVGWGGALGLFL